MLFNPVLELVKPFRFVFVAFPFDGQAVHLGLELVHLDGGGRIQLSQAVVLATVQTGPSGRRRENTAQSGCCIGYCTNWSIWTEEGEYSSVRLLYWLLYKLVHLDGGGRIQLSQAVVLATVQTGPSGRRRENTAQSRRLYWLPYKTGPIWTGWRRGEYRSVRLLYLLLYKLVHLDGGGRIQLSQAVVLATVQTGLSGRRRENTAQSGGCIGYCTNWSIWTEEGEYSSVRLLYWLLYKLVHLDGGGRIQLSQAVVLATVQTGPSGRRRENTAQSGGCIGYCTNWSIWTEEGEYSSVRLLYWLPYKLVHLDGGGRIQLSQAVVLATVQTGPSGRRRENTAQSGCCIGYCTNWSIWTEEGEYSSVRLLYWLLYKLVHLDGGGRIQLSQAVVLATVQTGLSGRREGEYSSVRLLYWLLYKTGPIWTEEGEYSSVRLLYWLLHKLVYLDGGGRIQLSQAVALATVQTGPSGRRRENTAQSGCCIGYCTNWSIWTEEGEYSSVRLLYWLLHKLVHLDGGGRIQLSQAVVLTTAQNWSIWTEEGEYSSVRLLYWLLHKLVHLDGGGRIQLSPGCCIGLLHKTGSIWTEEGEYRSVRL